MRFCTQQTILVLPTDYHLFWPQLTHINFWPSWEKYNENLIEPEIKHCCIFLLIDSPTSKAWLRIAMVIFILLMAFTNGLNVTLGWYDDFIEASIDGDYFIYPHEWRWWFILRCYHYFHSYCLNVGSWCWFYLAFPRDKSQMVIWCLSSHWICFFEVYHVYLSFLMSFFNDLLQACAW